MPNVKLCWTRTEQLRWIVYGLADKGFGGLKELLRIDIENGSVPQNNPIILSYHDSDNENFEVKLRSSYYY